MYITGCQLVYVMQPDSSSPLKLENNCYEEEVSSILSTQAVIEHTRHDIATLRTTWKMNSNCLLEGSQLTSLGNSFSL